MHAPFLNPPATVNPLFDMVNAVIVVQLDEPLKPITIVPTDHCKNP